MEATTTDLSWLCFVIPTILLIFVAIFSTLSRLRYAKRIRDVQATSAFTDLLQPEAKNRMRHLAFLSLMGISGMMIAMVILIIQQSGNFLMPFKVLTLIVGLLFAIMAAIGGFLTKREIDRRLN